VPTKGGAVAAGKAKAVPKQTDGIVESIRLLRVQVADGDLTVKAGEAREVIQQGAAAYEPVDSPLADSSPITSDAACEESRTAAIAAVASDHRSCWRGRRARGHPSRSRA
jgi:hypothetical protein